MESLQTAECIQTRCPNCQTVFEIDSELANGDDPRVRCGECYSIFDSLENRVSSTLPDDLLVDEAPGGLGEDDEHFFDDPEEKIVFEPDEGLDDRVQEFSEGDLFSDEAALPEVEYLEENEEIPELDFNAIDPDDEQFDGTLFDDVNLDYEGYEELAEGYDPEDAPVWQPPEELAESSENETVAPEPDSETGLLEVPADSTDLPFGPAVDSNESQTKGFGLSRLLMVLVLGLGLGGLYVFSNKSQLEQSPTTRPLVKAVCLIAGCELEALSDLKEFQVVRRNVYTHPTYGNALVINVVFRNDAGFAQTYPNLFISMSDVRGQIVAEREFLPHEYLKLARRVPIGEIPAGQTVDVSLEVRDPGDEAKSFELKFR